MRKKTNNEKNAETTNSLVEREGGVAMLVIKEEWSDYFDQTSNANIFFIVVNQFLSDLPKMNVQKKE